MPCAAPSERVLKGVFAGARRRLNAGEISTRWRCLGLRHPNTPCPKMPDPKPAPLLRLHADIDARRRDPRIPPRLAMRARLRHLLPTSGLTSRAIDRGGMGVAEAGSRDAAAGLWRQSGARSPNWPTRPPAPSSARCSMKRKAPRLIYAQRPVAPDLRCGSANSGPLRATSRRRGRRTWRRGVGHFTTR